MTTLVKWGLGFLAGLVCAGAMASEPIKDKDAFEKQYIECFMKNGANDCFFSIFRGHVDPNIGNADELSKKGNAFLKERLLTFGVYKVHILRKTVRADFFDERTYIIEYNNGTFGCFRVLFRKFLGGWYLFTYEWVGSDADIYKALQLETKFESMQPPLISH
ncbi:MAG: hypothetical protein LBU45_05515 [Azoarcus sp.]|jgi:hypothetical protein|nr:hypothetical protein [Azoarcus sp.]